jgi:hypothetical protein
MAQISSKAIFVTAEIAILNKTAVALAADSAITISSGNSQKKVFDTADKLFELSCTDPIAIMLNNDMNFMETPVPVLIKEYRSIAVKFETVAEAADGFLASLESFGESAEDNIRQRHLARQIYPILAWIQSRSDEQIRESIFGPNSPVDAEGYEKLKEGAVERFIIFLDRMLNRASEAAFVNDKRPELSENDKRTIIHTIESELSIANENQRAMLVQIITKWISKVWPFQAPTGVIVAGFGQRELFPTLRSFDLFGMVGGALKYQVNQTVDIDRNGTKARVIPFAQREMVERFVNGLDSDIERQIKVLCQRMLPMITTRILDQLELTDDAKAQLTAEAELAEQAFLTGLANDGFDAIRMQSQDEIEDMVEFMPKPEMARMAEALVNLTSIKRRVSEGMETVGGPIDVAVVSKAEGFVWVKRKHYFPAELNARYFERINSSS